MPPNDIHHMELTRAAPICIRFVESAFQVAESWDMSEKLRLFAGVVSKIGSPQ